ncbi:PREDICTED: YLP motif-containing protein 1-like isoform X2 [Papilio polytes]|uniref:YLP motif-containing protein 1-like isoform X2 n=1 Tax=Papilio polytes TaxID=76194 RepID=UPI0006760547|nr:PREDICTED: YLP motif-containing protein 1-like isoform X2 [Papilio polytes]
MSWPMQSGSWNAGVPMTPNMNMGYTPDQWTLIQQQNWQQWAQWQQQYAQWHLQYGDKYAEQMQTVPAMGAGPPLPPVNCAPPPAPPPPDQPPPPHKNDRPLYTPKPPPPSHTPTQPDNINNTKPMDGNSQAWSNTADNRNAIQNSEALKKLLEEERLFDIQFHKWEEEIEKWKMENVNHPDKQAYSEYEQKFEACRAQLLERRQQMKQKRARLTGIAPPTLSNTSSVNNIQLVPPPPPNSNKPNNVPPSAVQTQKPNSNPDTNYTHQSQFDQNQYQHYEDVQHAYNNDNSYVQAEATHTNKSYENVDPYYSNMEQSKFLPTNENSKGIPGLDLIPEDKMLKPQDVIDITGETMSEIKKIHSQTPDYTTISKGINNILGDEKIMNILSMVCQKPVDPVRNQSQSNIESTNSYQYNNNSDFGTRQNIPYSQGSNDLYNKGNGKFSQTYNQVQKEPMDQYYGNYSQNNVQNVPPRHQINTMPLAQPLQTQPIQSNIDNYHRAPHEARNIPDRPILPTPTPVPRSKWVDQPMFTPSIIVEYEHKPLRLKARDFIEPVHIFEYNHKSKHSDNKKKDFEREADELFVRHPRSSNIDSFPPERMNRELYHRDYERRPRDIREPYRPRPLMRDVYDDKRRGDGRLDDWRRDESIKFTRREDFYRDREKGREEFKDRYRVYRKDDNRNRSRSKEKENRKRDHSNDDDSFPAKKGKETAENKEIVKTKHVVMIDDILEPPGREMRPNKIVIFLRGLPGSGKSYLAKLIRDKEAEYGGTARIMSIDDYFMQEDEVEVNDPVTGKSVKKPTLKYEYEANMEESYLNSLRRAFKRSITDGYFTFIIFDAVNECLNSYSEVWNYARQHGFQAYVCTMEGDVATCHKRNIHNRTLEDIEVLKAKFAATPEFHIELDATTLLQSAAITDVHMEDADDALNMEDAGEQTEVENHFTSKWEKMDDAVKLARLDGTSRPLRPSQLSMEDYLQIDDWKPNVAKPGKKTVRCI